LEYNDELAQQYREQEKHMEMLAQEIDRLNRIQLDKI
jgi:hypothetical protein